MTNSQFPQSQAESDLLEVLLDSDEIPYPWNLEQPESEAYFEAAEADFSLSDGLGEDDLAGRSQIFFDRVERLWPAVSLHQSLREHFCDRIPEEILHRLSRAATDLSRDLRTQSTSLADRLVFCVREILPRWDEEDLQVLARPMVYAMRGNDNGGAQVRSARWEELSAVEQARLSLAIARYALEITENGQK
ncbi:MAG: hypothetical protein ACP5D7_09605 [Limnospira sp.]